MSVLSDFRGLAQRSVIYGLGSVLARSLTLILLPLYTRYLTPADYGIVAVSGTVTAILSIVGTLGLHAAIAKYFFSADDLEARRRTNGTIWTAILLASLVLTVVLDRLGSSWSERLFQTIPFDPYIRLAIWTAFFSGFSFVPLTLFQIEERAGHYSLATFGSALLTAALIVWFVVVKRLGAAGYLTGVCLASAIAAVPYAILSWRAGRWRLDRKTLGPLLVFSLPLVPQGLAAWVLDVSDRLLLQRYVPPAQIGLYALGFQFGALMNIIATSMNSAWAPFVYKRVAEVEAPVASLSSLATAFAATVLGVGLAAALLGRDLLLLVTAPGYHGAAPVVPWIVGGYVFAGLYFVPVAFLFVAGRTLVMPVITLVAGLLNILLNIWLMPRVGMMAAAWTTFASYAVMLLLAWAAAQKVYPVPYQYGRFVSAAMLAAVLFVLGNVVGYGTPVGIAVHAAAVLAFPVGLFAFSVITPAERQRLVLAAKQFAPWGTQRQ